MALFTQFKQWIELTASGNSLQGLTRGAAGNTLDRGTRAGQQVAAANARSGDGVYQTIGAYFERVSGGEPSYSVAEAAAANSRGTLYRSTRWRLSELTLEGNLTTDEFRVISQATRQFMRDGNGKFGVRRVLRDGEGGRLVYVYTGCSLLSPIGSYDGDVARDNEFLMMQMRIQPEALVIRDQGGLELQRFDPFDALDGGGYFAGREQGEGGGGNGNARPQGQVNNAGGQTRTA